MSKVLDSLKNFYKLAGKLKGYGATRFEYLVALPLLVVGEIGYSFVNKHFTTLGITSDRRLVAVTPFWVTAFGALFAVLVVIPFITLAARRLHDIGTTGWLVLVGYAPLLFLPVLTLVFFIGLGVIPSKQGANKFLVVGQTPGNLSDNPIVGFKPKRVLKILAIVIGIPVLLIVVLATYSSLTQH